MLKNSRCRLSARLKGRWSRSAAFGGCASRALCCAPALRCAAAAALRAGRQRARSTCAPTPTRPRSSRRGCASAARSATRRGSTSSTRSTCGRAPRSTSAPRPSKRITEAARRDRRQRDAADFDDVTGRPAGYRFSTEPDYVSHGGSLGASFDFADHAATLASRSRRLRRRRRAGDPGFSRPLRTLGGRLSFTQVFDPKMLVQVMYEVSAQDGYLSSPYRFVGDRHHAQRPALRTRAARRGGGTTSAGRRRIPTSACATRRPAPAPRARRRISAGLSYRFYLDDWDVMSHTVQRRARLVLPTSRRSLSLRTASTRRGASHYGEPSIQWPEPAIFSRATRNCRRSSSHRIGLDVEHEWHSTSSTTRCCGACRSGRPSTCIRISRRSRRSTRWK